MSMNVANCPKCGKVFVKNKLADICPACIKTSDIQCEACIKYLRENRGISLQELSDQTEVPMGTIIKFIRDGRISIMTNRNISYPCEVCGANIRERNMCDSCRQKLKKDVSNTMEDHNREAALKQQDNQVGYKISDRLRDRTK